MAETYLSSSIHNSLLNSVGVSTTPMTYNGASYQSTFGTTELTPDVADGTDGQSDKPADKNVPMPTKKPKSTWAYWVVGGVLVVAAVFGIYYFTRKK